MYSREKLKLKGKRDLIWYKHILLTDKYLWIFSSKHNINSLQPGKVKLLNSNSRLLPIFAPVISGHFN